MGRKVISILLPLMGILFITAYIRSATLDVVYTDYIRLVNSYLKDIYSLVPYSEADVLTRIPINYLERIVNVTFFNYSTTFDMMLGALALGISAIGVALYTYRKNLSFMVLVSLMMVMFSLNKWEMFTNGSGWVHFAAFAFFFYHYLVLDRVAAGNSKSHDHQRLIFLPWAIIIFIAGPYCAVYAVTMIIVYAFLGVCDNKKNNRYIIYIINVFIPLVIYMISNSYAVEEYAGATSDSMLSIIVAKPFLLVSFFVKSFAATIIEGETIKSLGIPQLVIFMMGISVIAAYLYALYLNLKTGLYKKSVFPLILIVSGGLNHILVTASRWIFLNDNYGMSSRYALQFQVGIIGIILTLGLIQTDKTGINVEKPDKTQLAIKSVVYNFNKYKILNLVCILFVIGNLVSSANEIHMAPYRQESFINMEATAIDFENKSDETLEKVLQYHDGAKTRQALELLKGKKLNIFSK